MWTSVFSVLPESTEYKTGMKWNILNLIGLVARVLKTLFQLSHVSVLQILCFSSGTWSNKRFWFNLWGLLEPAQSKLSLNLYNYKGAINMIYSTFVGVFFRIIQSNSKH